MAAKRASAKTKSEYVFGQSRRQPKMFRAGLYARVSTNDQQTLAMQYRAMREYAGRRGWTVALQVREVNSGAAKREAREKLLEAARRREIDLVLVWRLDRWGRSVTDLLATLQELEHLGVGFVSLTEALDLTTPPVAPWLACWRSSLNSKGRFFGNGPRPALPTRVPTGNGSADRQLRPSTLRKSGNCTAPVSVNPRSPAACRSAGHRCAGFWPDLFPEEIGVTGVYAGFPIDRPIFPHFSGAEMFSSC
jgi:resolvase-like protein